MIGCGDMPTCSAVEDALREARILPVEVLAENDEGASAAASAGGRVYRAGD